MPYVDYNNEGVTSDNLEAFLETLVGFARRKGLVAGQRWLAKLNPEFQRHVDMEYASCGDGYTPTMARKIVAMEFDHQPLPIICGHCGDVAWYRATASVMKCQGCAEAIVDYRHLYLTDLLKEEA